MNAGDQALRLVGLVDAAIADLNDSDSAETLVAGVFGIDREVADVLVELVQRATAEEAQLRRPETLAFTVGVVLAAKWARAEALDRAVGVNESEEDEWPGGRGSGR